MTPDTIVVGDGGDVVGCASKIVPLLAPGQWLDPGPFGCLGVGPSFAIAAKLLRPARRVLLIAGDGAFGLNGMEMETAVRFGLPMTVHDRQRRRLGPDPQSAALLLRRGARGGRRRCRSRASIGWSRRSAAAAST